MALSVEEVPYGCPGIQRFIVRTASGVFTLTFSEDEEFRVPVIDVASDSESTPVITMIDANCDHGPSLTLTPGQQFFISFTGA